VAQPPWARPWALSRHTLVSALGTGHAQGRKPRVLRASSKAPQAPGASCTVSLTLPASRTTNELPQGPGAASPCFGLFWLLARRTGLLRLQEPAAPPVGLLCPAPLCFWLLGLWGLPASGAVHRAPGALRSRVGFGHGSLRPAGEDGRPSSTPQRQPS
jgi:hypothetical protein